MAKLSDADLQAALHNLTGWQTGGDAIRRTFQFGGFPAAIAFVNRVAELAEAANHHPDIDIRYNKVSIGLSTHDEGGVTEKDVDLAAKLDQIAQAG